MRLEEMVFNNIIFLCTFLPVILILYYVLPGKLKNLVFLLGSLVFYAWGEPVYLLLLIVSVAFNYLGAMEIVKNRKKPDQMQKRYLVCIAVDILVFLFFGYIGVPAGITKSVPIGLGIYTLQMLSYLTDVYLGKVKVQKNILDFGVYAAMFPQMIAGPVVKYGDICKSLHVRKLSWGKLGEGILLFVCGLLKKVLVADRILVTVNSVLALKTGELSVFSAWIGCVSYMFYIYFACSGYADMAVGLGKMFGFELGKNFHYPYTAKNITEFWRRWNISLVSWFKEYIYLPFGGGKAGIMISWVLIGVWYGSTWLGAPWKTSILNSMLWGLYFGALVLLERYVFRFLKKLPAVVGHIYTWVLLLIGWAIFFTPTLGKAGRYIGAMFGIGGHGFIDRQGQYLLIQNGLLLVIAILGSTSLLHRIWETLLYRNKKTKEEKNRKKLLVRKNAAIVFAGLVVLVCLANLVVRDKKFSDRENRVLTQKPKFTTEGIVSGQYTRQYVKYKEDQFAFRNLLRGADTNLDLMLGRRQSGGVFKGKDKYLLKEIAQIDNKKVEKNLAAIKELQGQYPDVSVYMALIPDAANVLSQKLPANAVTEDQTEQLAQIQGMIENDVTWIDAQKVLKKNKKKDIYYRTDSHWTTLGAWYVSQELNSVMGVDTSKAPQLKPYAVSGSFNGDLASASGYETGYREPIYAYMTEKAGESTEVVVHYKKEGVKTATLYDSTMLDEKDQYKVFMGGDYGMIDIRTTADTTDRLLVVKDSYANCMIPFLVPYYREIIVVDPAYYEGNIKKILKENKIASVLFLYDCNTFVQDDKISGVLTDGKAE